MSEVTVTETHGTKRNSPRRVYQGNGRSYMSSTWREFDSKPRLYVSIEGENLLENFAFRWDRPYKLYRTKLAEIFAKLGLPEGTKANWSQKAGCSCGCSPGFILTIPETQRKNLTTRRVRHIDFWTTLVGNDAKVEDEPNAGRVMHRADALKAMV